MAFVDAQVGLVHDFSLVTLTWSASAHVQLPKGPSISGLLGGSTVQHILVGSHLKGGTAQLQIANAPPGSSVHRRIRG